MRAADEELHGAWKEDFELPERLPEENKSKNPLED